MAEISNEGGGGSHKKKGKKRSKKMSTRIDFTPMVDLGFLLITFFMLTTTLSKPKTMEIGMPDKTETPEPNKIDDDVAMTILLSENDKVYYYFGMKDPQLELTNFSKNGIRKILLERNDPQIRKLKILQERLDKKLITEKEYKAESATIRRNPKAPFVIIKSDDKAKYKNLVDILDEIQITNIGSYAIVDISDLELELIAGRPM
jgi:biopolymer transport protein ExbD